MQEINASRQARTTTLLAHTIGTLLMFGAMSFLTACGGSGGSGNNTAAPTLSAISVTPAAMSVPSGLTEQFTATGIYSDSSKQDVTKSVSWTSSNTMIAVVSATGMASTVASGSASISASMSGVSGNTTLTVTPASLVSIDVTPAALRLANGSTQQFVAMGVYTDNSKQDLTSAVTWASSNPTVAFISNSSGSNGLTTTLTVGTTSVTAMLNGLSSQAVTLTVTPVSLVSITLTPASPSIALGTSQSFKATGTYSDHSTQDITSQVTWSSASAAVASISNTAGSNGQAKTLAVGTSAISAALNAVNAPAVILTVTPATLVSLAVTPIAPSLAAGQTQSFTATGTYSDSSTQNITAAVTWMSSDITVASISNAIGSDGLATSLKTGSVSITAQLGSITSAPTTLTVTPSALVSIAVTPAAPSLLPGTSEQFTATGTYTDSSTQDLTNSATWVSSNTAVASISNTLNSNGLATGLTIGTTQVTAAVGTVVSQPVTLAVVARSESVLYSFGPIPPITYGGDGYGPAGGLTQASDGNFYGTTINGGSQDVGTVFKITPAGVETVLYSFAAGIGPSCSLIQGTDGDFYGTTIAGAAPDVAVAANLGTVFKITPAGVVTYLYSFAGGSDGAAPVGALIQASDGNFYGTTTKGGAYNLGTVFMVTPAGVETVLHSFAGGADGAVPNGSLIQGTDGNFYGTTASGNTTVKGTVFKITPAGIETVLYDFSDAGFYQPAGLILGSDGNFYGTTSAGPANTYGTVFKITPAGVLTVLYTFTSLVDGAIPQGSLIQANDGNFYGATAQGGLNGTGTLFEITPAGVETVLYSFVGGHGSTDGYGPVGSLIQASDGHFYGVTNMGGTNNGGTVFQF